MIFIEDWPLIWQIACLLFPILLGGLGLGIGLKMALSKDLQIMLEALKNSSYITARNWMAKGGVFTRLHLVSVIGGMVWFPKPGLKRGVLSEDDLSAFPSDLKRKHGWSQALTCAGMLLLILLWVLRKLG